MDDPIEKFVEGPKHASRVQAQQLGSGFLSPDYLAQQSKYLVTLLNWLIKRGANAHELPGIATAPITAYLNYHKVHLATLARILVSIKKAEPIGNQVTELENNIADYVKETTSVAGKIGREFPADPWQGVQAPIATVLMAPMLKQNKRFVQEWNKRLEIYEILVRAGLEVTEYLAEQGDNMLADTSKKVEELRTEIKKLEVHIGLDQVLKYRYAERLDWIDFSKEKVRSAIRDAEEASVFLQGCLRESQKAQRL